MIGTQNANSDVGVEPSESRLPFCPQCQYSLRGLPATHRCPECGLGFDAESLMWIAKYRGLHWRPDWRLLVAAPSSFVGPLLLFLICYFSKYDLMGIFIAVLNIVLGLHQTWQWYDRRYRSLPFLALLPDGIWFRDGTNRVRSIEWESVGHAVDDPITGLLIKNAKGYPAAVADVFSSRNDLQVAIRTITARLESRMKTDLESHPMSGVRDDELTT